VDKWWTEVSEAARNTATLTPANQMVLAYQFTEARRAHPEGFTMDLFGNLVTPKSGYAVGMTPDSFDNVADALSTLAAIQEQWGFRNLHLGFWRDEQDGSEYVDVTMVTHSREMAEALGAKMRQRALWDFSTGSEIRLTVPSD
jgi:hypothetical protein